MRWFRIASYFVVAVVCVALLAVVVVITTDLGRFKPFAERLVSESLGREFRIDGKFEPVIGSSIRLVAEDLRLASTEWSTSADLVSVAGIEISIETWSLMSGPIIIESLSIDGARINLETADDGSNNWTMAGSTPADNVSDPQVFDELPALINELRISDLVLSYASPSLQQPLKVTIDEARESIQDLQNMSIALTGQVNETPLSFNAEAGDLQSLKRLQNVTMSFEAGLGEVSFRGNLLLDDLLLPSRPTAQLQLQGPNAEYLTSVLGFDQVTTGPLDLRASVSPDAERMKVEIRGSFGEFTVDSGGTFDDLQNLEEFQVDARASGPNIGAIGRLLGNDAMPDDPFDVETAVSVNGTHIRIRSAAIRVGETRFDATGEFVNFPSPDGAAVSLHVSGPDFGRFNRLLGLPGKLTGAFNLDVALQQMPSGNASVRIDAAASDLGFEIDGVIVGAPGFVGTTINARCKGANFATVAAAGGLTHAPTDAFELALSVERTASGTSISNGLITIGKNQAVLTGLVGDQPLQSNTDLRMQLSGPDLGRTLTEFGIDATGLEASPWTLGGRIYLENGRFNVDKLRATAGGDSISVNGTIGEQPFERDTNVTFNLAVNDLKATLARFDLDNVALPAGALEASGRVRASAGSIDVDDTTATLAGAKVVVGGRVGAMPSLNGTNLDIRLSGSDLSRIVPVAQDVLALNKPFSLESTARIDSDLLKISKLKFKLDEMNVTSELEVAIRPLAGSGRFSIAADSPDINQLAPGFSEVSMQDSVPMRLRASGKWQDGLWTFDDVMAVLSRGTLVLKGTIDQPPGFDRTDFLFDWNIASLRNLSTLAGREFPDHPAQFKFHMTGTRESLAIDNFTAQFGDSDLAGSFSWHYGEKPRFETSFESKKLDVNAYLPPATEKPPVDATAHDAARQKLIPDTAIPMDMLDQFDGSVDVRIAELVMRNRSQHDIVLTADIRDGALNISKISAVNETGGVVTATAALRPFANGADLWIDMQGSGLSAGFLTENPDDVAALPKLDVDTVLTGSGATYSGLAGSLNGYLSVTGGEGRIRSSALRYFTSDFVTEVINTVNPFAATDSYTNVQCSAFLLKIDNGVVSGEPAVVAQTDRIQVFVDADVDLKTEKLNAYIKTVPQQGLGVSLTDLVNPYVKVGGTLVKPTLVLDPKGVMIEGGAAVATAGLSILALKLKDRFLSPKDQCGKAVEEAAGDFTEIREKYRRNDSP